MYLQLYCELKLFWLLAVLADFGEKPQRTLLKKCLKQDVNVPTIRNVLVKQTYVQFYIASQPFDKLHRLKDNSPSH
jgi:hypothetical protein